MEPTKTNEKVNEKVGAKVGARADARVDAQADARVDVKVSEGVTAKTDAKIEAMRADAEAEAEKASTKAHAEADAKVCARAKELSRASFNQQASSYDEGIQGQHARRLYPHVLHEVVTASEKRYCARRFREESLQLLDVGCGTGALAEVVLSAVPPCNLAGVDISENMLDVARRRFASWEGAPVQFVLADSEALPFADSVFDVVYCCDSFHHYPDLRKAAFEMWRVLVPGGTLVIGDCWQPAPARALMNATMKFGRDGDVRIYSENELREILGEWFAHVAWQRVGTCACIAKAVK